MTKKKNAASNKSTRRTFITTSTALGAAALTTPLAAQEPEGKQANPWLTVVPRAESTTPWMMPAHFGMPAWQRPEDVALGDAQYDDVTMISIDYLTMEEKLKEYLPLPYELDGPPVVSVTYSMNRDISWLAGGDYNIIQVTVRARYPGENREVSGHYALVLWENLTTPILTGRELQGMPKIYGDIDNHRIFKGTWRTALSNHGKTMMEMEATDLKQMTAADFENYKSKHEKVNLMGWKYIPNENRSGPILSYATRFTISYRFRKAWSATGTLRWHARKWEELPTQAHIVNALEGLPIRKIVSCTVSNTSLTLHSSKVERLI